MPPIVWCGAACGFQGLLDLGVNAGIVVSEPSYDCVVIDSSKFGVCVSIEGGLVEYLLLVIIVNLVSP